jgi:membrane-associated protease RseP (regulator of RpoE activity)
MTIDTIAMLALLLGLMVFMYFTRKRLQVNSFLKIFYFCMYKTKLGMKAMERIARKHENLLKKSGYVMIAVGFIGMLLMIEELVRGALLILRSTESLTVGVVLPIEAKGVFYVPFFYWIISIMFIMVVHEFGHGLVARAHKVKITSTGLAFLGAIIPIIPGAFVEIDEKHLAKKSKYAQLSIFAAGPFVNIAFGLLFWAVFLLALPALQGMFYSDGMHITSIADGSPAAITGFASGALITAIDGTAVNSVDTFEKAFAGKKPGDTVSIATDKGTKEAVLSGADKGYLGIQVQESRHIQMSVIRKYGVFLPLAFAWLGDLVFWLFLLNLGVGLFNLVPLGPIDGGRMFHTAMQRFVHHRHARTTWHVVTFVMLAIIAGTLISAFV